MPIVTMKQEEGVYALVTELCTRTAAKYGVSCQVPPKRLVAKMRSQAYEIILKRSTEDVLTSKGEPIVDLLSHYLITQSNVKNVAEYKRSVELKKIIDTICQTKCGNNKDFVYKVLKLLIGLTNTAKEDHCEELYKNPFSFGMLNEMLPKPRREAFGSSQPYPYYPSHVFHLPFSLKREQALLRRSQTYTEYVVENFDSKSNVQERSCDIVETKCFIRPLSISSVTTTGLSNSPYNGSTMNFPRLTAPRDLMIPVSIASDSNVKVTFSEVKEVYIGKDAEVLSDIWEIAKQIDKDVPDDIWDVAAKMPPVNERRLIATSSREMVLWRRTHGDLLRQLSLISEKQFIRDIMYLTIGIATKTFPFSEDSNCFFMRENLVLEGISKEHISGYVSDLLLIGTYYRRLFTFAFNQSLDESLYGNGLIYEAAREVIRRYLLKFRLKATEIYEETTKESNRDLNCMPTLLQILFHLEPLKYEIETIVSIYKIIDPDSKDTLPIGVELMSYLFDEISMVTHKQTAYILFNSLFTICNVYFKFIERFIFEGELDDVNNEFFIRKDCSYVNTRSKRYWDKGFHIAQSQAVPDFLKPLAKFILLCGKSLRLLKHCNPSDPLVLLISSDHPSVKSCASFQELNQQQQVLDVYRTRCLFVSGEPITFDQIQLKQEAERKAFAEMASIKQAETMEKIVAERKRLAQLIIAEKQHSLRVLEQAMAEAKAAKQKAKQRERQRFRLERAAEKASEEVDALIKADERNKMLEYYSKLNEKVEKSKMHAEWKIRRLQLDEARIQLLSTEERNLKREKLELEHKRNEEIMSMSIQSTSSLKSEGDTNYEDNENESHAADGIEDKGPEVSISESETNSMKPRSSTGVLLALCNAAKHIFISKSDDAVDNKKDLDVQGNVVPVDNENNPSVKYTQSSNVIGAHLNDEYDNQEFLEMRETALKNKYKIMAHEFGHVDKDNNQVDHPSVLTDSGVYKENNVDHILTEVSALSNSDRQDHPNFEAMTEAQKQAHFNKLKVLGVEYNLPLQIVPRNEAANIAQEEALRNKEKILGSKNSEMSDLTVTVIHKKGPANIAQEEALLNRDKILGTESSSYESALSTETPYKKPPANIAQEEALINRNKILGSENSEFDSVITTATSKRDPANIAQEEASRNRDNMLGSDKVKPLDMNSKHGPPKRMGLTLNLKPYVGVTAQSSHTSLGTGAVTPGDFYSGLDLATPTTAEIGAPTCDVFTPHSESNKLEAVIQPDKPYLSIDGFDFSILVDETVDDEMLCPIKDTPQSSPSKETQTDFSRRYSSVNYFDGTYCLDEFDPFGVKDMRCFSKNHFTSKMHRIDSSSCYTHPSVIMEEVKKKPYQNMFLRAMYMGSDDDEKKIDCDNIATLTACLQRSVMLPLTYQLEVVNNSILTYFLVNLDMYEHLRSLKDYFFLMDGEFSKSICQNLFARLVKTINPQELLNFATLHSILDKALGSSISHVHKFSENLSFTITESPLSFQHSSPDVLQCLSLTYTVSWPLNIILSQEALLRYAKVFQFLLKMRRISWVLSEDFESLKLTAKFSKEHSRKLMKSPHYISVQIYRHVMASLIRALDNYIVTTCILSSWKEFENDLKKARTLDDLYECHVVYIKKVLFRCLLNNRSTPVMKLLNDLFTVILKFSRVLKQGEFQQKEPNGFFTHSNFVQLQDLFHLFQKLAKYLNKVITKLMECGYQRHLAELLIMINLNGYYDLDSSKSRDEQNFSTETT